MNRGQIISKSVAVTVCIICFFALCWEQLIAYLARNKGLSQQLVKVKERKLPVLAFCLENPYVPEYNAQLLEEDGFRANIRNFSVTLKGKALGGYESVPIDGVKVQRKPRNNHETFPLSKGYRNKCPSELSINGN